MSISLSPARHRFIFIFGLLLLVTGLSLGASLISVAESLIFVNWCWEGNFTWKWQRIKESKLFWIVCAFYFFHIVGFAWSSNLVYALKDLWVKVPIFEFALIFVSTRPLEKKEWRLVLSIYIAALVASTLWTMVFYFGWRPLENGDLRKLSRFDSHIRFSLKILMGIFICAWLGWQQNNLLKKISWLAVGAWLLVFLFILGSLNGIVILAIMLVVYFFIAVLKMQKNFIKYFVVTCFIGGGVYLYFTIKKEYREFFVEKEQVFEKVDWWTPTHDLYYHEANLARENGYFVWRYVAYPELKRGWNKMSRYQFDSLDRKGNKVLYTLIRYITSKGMRKDTLALTKLSKQDIENIENGLPNYRLAGAPTFKVRLYEMFWEIDDFLKNGSISKHSTVMKMEYWHIGLRIAKKNFFAGVGTGDIQDAFNREYEITGSKLKKEEDRRRAHNVFIEITATLGLCGLILLLGFIFYPFKALKELHWLYLPFFLISFISYFSEDTIETQMGASFVGFFYSLFVFLYPKKNDAEV